VEIDTLVLIKDDHVDSTKWTMGRIVQVHPSTDELARVVTVKMADSILCSPICKICPCTSIGTPRRRRFVSGCIMADGRPRILFVPTDEAGGKFGFLPLIELSLRTRVSNETR